MSDDKIRQAILNGLHKQNPLGSLFGNAARSEQADHIMNELKPVLDEQADARVFEIAAFTKRQTFAVLWRQIPPVDHPDTTARDWLTFIAWPALFPGHCLRCHGFADKPCGDDDYGHGTCPACVQDEGEG